MTGESLPGSSRDFDSCSLKDQVTPHLRGINVSALLQFDKLVSLVEFCHRRKLLGMTRSRLIKRVFNSKL